MHLVINLTKVNATSFNGNLTTTSRVIIPSYPLNPSNVTNKTYVDNSLNVLNVNINTHITNSDIHLNSTEYNTLSGITITNAELNNASGITSGVQAQINTKANKAGDTLTGFLNLLTDPINSDDLATKNYVDQFSNPGFSQFNVGDLILYTNRSTPTGFLKCNGAAISKTTYSNLYSVIGDKYRVTSDPTLFNLPDFTSYSPSSNLSYYIKT